MNERSVRRLDVPVGDLVFEADAAGSPEDPLVLLLHGFPQTSHTYRDQLPALAAAGFFAVAPNQRGYSPRARPPELLEYATERLVEDALSIATELGAARFHLVGHDWGGQLAWLIAAQHGERVRTLTVLSRPHPMAFARALADDPAQAERSRHHQRFRDASTARRLLENGGERLRKGLLAQGVAAHDAEAYLARLGDEAALDAALNWYRARDPQVRADVPCVGVPTLYVWGDADATVGRRAAEGTSDFVGGPYRFLVIPGAGHFLTDQASAEVTEALCAHLAAWPDDA